MDIWWYHTKKLFVYILTYNNRLIKEVLNETGVECLPTYPECHWLRSIPYCVNKIFY